MKKVFLIFLLSIFAYTGYSQTYKYKIVGKGNSGQYQCSGYVSENLLFKTITLYVSDMLNHEYRISKKEQVNDNTIRYVCLEDNPDWGFKEIYIIKQKCPHGKNTYFYQFPPLYKGQGSTVYKVVLQ